MAASKARTANAVAHMPAEHSANEVSDVCPVALGACAAPLAPPPPPPLEMAHASKTNSQCDMMLATSG